MNKLFDFWLKGYISTKEAIRFLDEDLGYFPGEISKIVHGWIVAAKYLK